MDLGSGESYQGEQYAQPDEFEGSMEKEVAISPIWSKKPRLRQVLSSIPQLI
jgi:hypothetical protein